MKFAEIHTLYGRMARVSLTIWLSSPNIGYGTVYHMVHSRMNSSSPLSAHSYTMDPFPEILRSEQTILSLASSCSFTVTALDVRATLDFILAIFPQYSWYSVPSALKNMSFGELFLDVIAQAKESGNDLPPLIYPDAILPSRCNWLQFRQCSSSHFPR